MSFRKPLQVGLALVACLALADCSRQRSASSAAQRSDAPTGSNIYSGPGHQLQGNEKSSIWDVFGPNKSENTVQVNRYLWAATLDVLNFLPVQSVDPFTGVIVTGYGTPPGGGRSYRATVHINDPALDARSLNVSLQTSGGPVSPATARAVEDAILTRARQMRVGDDKL